MQFPVLSLLIFIPLLTGVALLVLPNRWKPYARWIALGSAGITAILSLIVYFGYDVAQGGYQFQEQYPWVPALGISYHVGVDGISVPMIFLTGLLTTLAIAISPILVAFTQRLEILVILAGATSIMQAGLELTLALYPLRSGGRNAWGIRARALPTRLRLTPVDNGNPESGLLWDASVSPGVHCSRSTGRRL